MIKIKLQLEKVNKMNSKQKIIYTKNCLEFLGYKCVTPNDKDFRIYEGKNSVIPSMVDANFNDDFLNNWNWIMEVVEAIEKELDGSRPFKYGKLDALDFNIDNKSVKVKASFWTNPNTVNGNYWSYFKYNKKYNNISKKEAVVQAINQFLIWYNENNNNRQSR